jgi:hypothetical protein
MNRKPSATGKKTTPAKATKKAISAAPRRPATPLAEVARAKAQAARVELWTNIISTAAMVGVGVIAFLASYQELRDLCVIAGKSAEHWWSTANLIPIGVDLMLIIASIRLRRKGIPRIARLIARISSLAGLLLSLAGNMIHGWWHNVSPETSANYLLWLTLVVSAVPVASLLACVEMLTHTHKDTPSIIKGKGAKVSQPAVAPAPQVNAHEAAVPVDARPVGWLHTGLARLYQPMGRKA